MQLQLKAPKLWVAPEAVDFRKSLDGLSAIVLSEFKGTLTDAIYIFYNRAKNKLKLLARHHNGDVLIYKRLDKKQFTLKQAASGLYEITEQQLSWLLAGLDGELMSTWKEDVSYEDYH
ncbi:MAG: hypothetical protein A3H43_01025 [Gammaproteobacteria bacterium RIFCSPLOWO2_02_FULL_42_9]|nr:MAG: hypothetical protein A3H43_01025 [Gammaproteobacteria bacterium RIFCSPLOWO2_02_FULL_42_9]